MWLDDHPNGTIISPKVFHIPHAIQDAWISFTQIFHNTVGRFGTFRRRFLLFRIRHTYTILESLSQLPVEVRATHTNDPVRKQVKMNEGSMSDTHFPLSRSRTVHPSSFFSSRRLG